MSDPGPDDIAAIALAASRASLLGRHRTVPKNEGRCPHCGDFTPPPAPPSPPPEAA